MGSCKQQGNLLGANSRVTLSNGLCSVLWLEVKKRWQVPDSVIWWKTYAWPWARWFSVSRAPWTGSRENANTSWSANTTSSASCCWLGPTSSPPEEGKENFQKPSYVTFTQRYKLTQLRFVFLFPWTWYDSMETTLQEIGGPFWILSFQK